MKGKRSIFDDNPISSLGVGISDFLNTVWVRNPLESSSFMVFWLLLEQEWAEQCKPEWAYMSGFEQGCNCGSITCDECNPGWDIIDEEVAAVDHGWLVAYKKQMVRGT